MDTKEVSPPTTVLFYLGEYPYCLYTWESFCSLIMMYAMKNVIGRDLHVYSSSHRWILCAFMLVLKLFLCQSFIFPVLLFQFLLESIEFRPVIASAFPEFLELIGWHVQKLSHNRRTFTEKCYCILCSFLTQFPEPVFSQIFPFVSECNLKTFSIYSKCLDPWQPMWQFQMQPLDCTDLLYSTWEGNCSVPEMC